MDQDGLEQAQERFARMSIAAAVVASEAPLEEREGAWLDVVNIFGTIYSKLEQAAKATPEATKWFAKRRAERKSDPLLQYMHPQDVPMGSATVWAMSKCSNRKSSFTPPEIGA